VWFYFLFFSQLQIQAIDIQETELDHFVLIDASMMPGAYAQPVMFDYSSCHHHLKQLNLITKDTFGSNTLNQL